MIIVGDRKRGKKGDPHHSCVIAFHLIGQEEVALFPHLISKDINHTVSTAILSVC